MTYLLQLCQRTRKMTAYDQNDCKCLKKCAKENFDEALLKWMNNGCYDQTKNDCKCLKKCAEEDFRRGEREALLKWMKVQHSADLLTCK